MSESVENLIEYCRANDRVCPLKLWKKLPHRVQTSGGGWEPPLPLILAAWHDTPALSKMLRLQEHIMWAAKHGSLETVGKFLRDLREDQWLHLNE